MNEHFVDIEIYDDESLLKACDFLHDANCYISMIKYDKSAGTWQAVFEREFYEYPDFIERHRKLFIFEKVLFPVAHCVLTLNGVNSYNIEDKSKLKRYTFNECRIKKESYEFDFCEDMKICLAFENKPSGQLKDHYFIDKKITMWSVVNPFRGK